MLREENRKRQKQKIVETAQKIINNEVGIIEGVRLISSLRFDVTDEKDHTDSDFVPFVGIDSETDSLPVGEEHKHWAAYALVEKDKEIQEVEDFYRDKVLAACEVLIDRFSE